MVMIMMTTKKNRAKKFPFAQHPLKIRQKPSLLIILYNHFLYYYCKIEYELRNLLQNNFFIVYLWWLYYLNPRFILSTSSFKLEFNLTVCNCRRLITIDAYYKINLSYNFYLILTLICNLIATYCNWNLFIVIYHLYSTLL